VHGTGLSEVLAASGAGKGQFYRYFDDKDHLVREVVGLQFARVRASQGGGSPSLDSWVALRAWFDAVIAYQDGRGLAGGCPLGSLAAELADTDERVRAELSAVFEQWTAPLRHALQTMQDRGEIRPGADPAVLAETVLALFEGGILLATVHKRIDPLRHALDAAYRLLRAEAAGAEAARPAAPARAGESTPSARGRPRRRKRSPDGR
jgi:AcrR family transcriptional regulator